MTENCKCGQPVYIMKTAECKTCYGRRWQREHPERVKEYKRKPQIDSCPKCGGSKNKTSKQCQNCYKEEVASRPKAEPKPRKPRTEEQKARHNANKRRYRAEGRNHDHTKADRRAKRRALERGAVTHTYGTPVMQLLIDFYGDKCMKCGVQGVTLDHVVPLSKGGDNTLANYQLLCMTCNIKKNAGTLDLRPSPRWVDRIVG